MKPIKIFGESKTGTTYLQHLLELNTDADIIGGGAKERLGWKHGFPQSGNATYIFIFRGIYEWAKSLIVSHKDKRFNGLRNQFGSDENWFWNTWNNPIECRTAKYYSYLGFGKVHDAIFISLEWLTKDQESLMLELKRRGYSVNDPVKDIKKHVYYDSEGRDNPKRKPLQPDQIRFIDAKKDDILEQWVDNLTIL